MYESVATSDWHTGVLARFFNDHVKAQIQECEKPFIYAVTNGIGRVDILGDITHKPTMDEAYLIAYITLLLKYPELKVRYILGNHDFAQVGKSSILVLKCLAENGMLPNLRIFESPKIEMVGGVAVTYMPYPCTEVPNAKDDKPRLIMAHIEHAGAIGDNGRTMKSVGEYHRLGNRTEADYTVSGHLHTHQIIKRHRTTFIGSLFQTNFGEKGVKGFLHLKAKMVGAILKVQPTHVNSRPNFSLKNHTVESESEFEAIGEDKTSFYKLTLAEGVVAPKNLLRDFPNIVGLNGRVLRSIEANPMMDTNGSDLPKITLMTGLVKFLTENNLNDAEVKRAVRMVKEALAHLRSLGKIT